ncbi:MAG: TM2 domain-containing protein [Candidatus Pacearchaeota archaeon]|nr:TM2 domain-containing protein [Candidatus Pacearchaeota archaeon]
MASNKNKRRINHDKAKIVKVNWLLCLLMSIFFGWAGVDRFIMGKIGTGILKLLISLFTLFLFSWVWWIIDIILIASKHKFQGVVWIES